MPGLKPLTRWRLVAPVVSVLVLLSVAGAVLHQAPGAFRERAAAAGAYAGLTPHERTFIALRAYDIDTDVFELALQHVPLSAKYALVTGPDTYVSSGLVIPKVDALAPYVFLPRRQVGVDQADWIVSYGVRPAAVGVRLGAFFDTGHGRWVAEVLR